MKEKRRTRGTGCIFRKHLSQKQKDAGVKQNPNWYLQYSNHGRIVREATHATDRAAAVKILRQRLHEIDLHTFKKTAVVSPPRVEELYGTLKLDKQASGKSLVDAQGRWKHLEAPFGKMLASEVTTEDLRRYIAARQKEEAANATINRELATLRRMMNLAKQSGRMRELPYFPMLKEDNVRQGFVEAADYVKLVAAADEPWLKAFLECAWTWGWRKGELLGLRVRHLNFATRTVRLDVGSTKNGEGREVMMTTKVFELLKGMASGKKAQDAVFTRGKSNPKPVQDVRKAWKALTEQAGLPGLLVHDMRRSASKNMRLAGIPESVAMKFTGHKTRAMFERYAIVSPADQQQAVRLLEAQAAAVRRAEKRRAAKIAAEARAAKASVPQIVPFPESVTTTVQ